MNFFYAENTPEVKNNQDKTQNVLYFKVVRMLKIGTKNLKYQKFSREPPAASRERSLRSLAKPFTKFTTPP